MDSFVVNVGNKNVLVAGDDGFIPVTDAAGNQAVVEFPIKGEIITVHEGTPCLVVKINFIEICKNIEKYLNYDGTAINITQVDIDETSVSIAFVDTSGGDEPPIG